MRLNRTLYALFRRECKKDKLRINFVVEAYMLDYLKRRGVLSDTPVYRKPSGPPKGPWKKKRRRRKKNLNGLRNVISLKQRAI
jgi:hypothetical protein